MASQQPLPPSGEPFRVGERIAFAPLEVGPATMWLGWEEAVILAVDHEAETVKFRHVSEPDGVSHGQGFENIVRVTPNYVAWRRAWTDALARTGSEDTADRETAELWLRVLAEHPTHGPTLDAERRRRLLGGAPNRHTDD